MQPHTASLITPERLRLNVKDCFQARPKWAHMATLSDEDLCAFDEAVIVARIGEGMPELFYLDPTAYAILCELTRYGNSIANNSNRTANERWYLKITYANTAKDASPISRLLMDALPCEAVRTCEDYRDL